MLRYSTRLRPADRHPARVGVVGIDSKDVALDPVGQEPHLLIGRPGLPGRRHDASAHILEHRPPKLRVHQMRIAGGKTVQGDVPLLRPVAMTPVAIIDQDRLDRFFKPRCCWTFRRECGFSKQEERKQDRAPPGL